MSDCFFTPVFDDSCSFTEDLRFLDAEQTTQEREVFSNYFLEEIERYGIEVGYQQNLYQLSSHDPIYGEHTNKSFGNVQNLIMYVVYNSDSIVLNQLGIESDADVTAFIHISSFQDAYGADSEPNMGDIMRMTEYGSTDRPNGRAEPVFQVTRRDDEDLQQINPLMGHYVWLLRGKRYDYSYEDNVDPENSINQINDDVPQSDGLSGTPSLSSVKDNVDKTYESSSDELGQEIFDYNENLKSDDDIYGNY